MYRYFFSFFSFMYYVYIYKCVRLSYKPFVSLFKNLEEFIPEQLRNSSLSKNTRLVDIIIIVHNGKLKNFLTVMSRKGVAKKNWDFPLQMT